MFEKNIAEVQGPCLNAGNIRRLRQITRIFFPTPLKTDDGSRTIKSIDNPSPKPGSSIRMFL
ncbi:MAG: hypothetical protein VR65_17645 [Desulfobulbaceae bacterium BRH_c16a]|nr:MAG: hypothetical protein VR65_17645 [Desulfobulbaceae bacterium BRH_c16a]